MMVVIIDHDGSDLSDQPLIQTMHGPQPKHEHNSTQCGDFYGRCLLWSLCVYAVFVLRVYCFDVLLFPGAHECIFVSVAQFFSCGHSIKQVVWYLKSRPKL